MKKNVSLGKQLQFVNLKMLVLTHLSFYSHVPPHPHPLNYLGWGWGAESTVALRDTRYEMPPFKAEARGRWSRSTHRAGPSRPSPTASPLDRPASVPRNVEPGLKNQCSGWRMTLTLSATFLGTDVFQFLRKRKEGRRRKRLFPRSAVGWCGAGGSPGGRAVASGLRTTPCGHRAPSLRVVAPQGILCSPASLVRHLGLSEQTGTALKDGVWQTGFSDATPIRWVLWKG